jgi:arylsulfatase A-like enzyme
VARSDAVVSSLDLLPTILDYTGVTYPANAQAGEHASKRVYVCVKLTSEHRREAGGSDRIVAAAAADGAAGQLAR